MDQNSAVLVTGGGGYLGNSVLSQLAKSERTVLCLYRHSKPVEIENIYPVCNDLSSADLLAVPLRGVSTVVHLAWDHSFNSSGLNESQVTSFKSKNLIALKNLLAACEKAEVKRIIFLSIKGAKNNTSNLFLKEKYLGEVMTLNSKIDEKIILRSDIIYSKKNSVFIDSLNNMLSLPVVVPVTEKKAKYSPVHLEDVSKVICQYVEKPEENASMSLVRHLSSKKQLDSKSLLVSLASSNGLKNKIFIPEPFSRVFSPVIDSKRGGSSPSLGVFAHVGKESEWSEPVLAASSRDFENGLKS